MHTILALMGSGEFTDAMIDVDVFLLHKLKEKYTDVSVAIVPTAAGKETTPDSWISDGINHFKKLSTEAFGVKALNKEEMESPEFFEIIQKANFIYFSGGDPKYLLETLRNTTFCRKVFEGFERGKLLAGSSAGAMVMGNVILKNPFFAAIGDQKDAYIEAFGLIPFLIIPHYDRFSKFLSILEVTKFQDSLPENTKGILGIDEDTALIIFDSNEAFVMGKGGIELRIGQKVVKYKSGEKFNLTDM